MIQQCRRKDCFLQKKEDCEFFAVTENYAGRKEERK
jgi:hypothetical protein